MKQQNFTYVSMLFIVIVCVLDMFYQNRCNVIQFYKAKIDKLNVCLKEHADMYYEQSD